MLDGLDELGKDRVGKDGDHYDPRKRFVVNVPQYGPVIITCRVNDYADIGEQIGLTGAVTLKQLTDMQIREYLAEMPALWQTLQSDRDLCDVVRIPLLLSIMTRAYQDNASEVSTLPNLKAAPGTLREKIFDVYVRSRFAHERRHGRADLSFSTEEAYRLLGQAAIDGVNYSDGGLTEYGITMEESIRDRLDVKAASFIEQMLRFHLLVRDHARKLIFIHSLLRDHFAFRYALSFVQGSEFKYSSGFKDREYRFRMRALQFLAESGDERALEPLLEHVGPYVDFPLVYSLCFADPRVLLALARTLLVDKGLAQYDYVSDAAQDQIKIVAKKLGAPASARVLASAVRSAPTDERAAYVFGLGFLGLTEGLDAGVAATLDEDATVRGCAAYALAAIGISMQPKVSSDCLLMNMRSGRGIALLGRLERGSSTLRTQH